MEKKFTCPILGLCDPRDVSEQELFRAGNGYNEEITALTKKLETLKKEKEILNKVETL